MAVSFNFEKAVANRLGLCPIKIRVTIDRDHWRVKTDIELKDADWNAEKQEVRRSNPDYATLNDILKEKKKKISDLYYLLEKEQEIVTIDMLRDAYEGKGSGSSFIEYAKQRMDDLAAQGDRGNRNQYRDFYIKFTDYINKEGKNDLTFKELSPALLKNFERYLRNVPNRTHKGEKLGANTVHRHMKVFKALLNDAVREGKLKVNDNPFYKYEMPTKIKTSKERLNDTEIAKIESLELENGSNLWNCRNYFLFSYYNAGIRVADLCLLRMSNIVVDSGGLRLVYTMKKNGKSWNSKLVPQAEAIVRQYWSTEKPAKDFLFPILSCYADLPEAYDYVSFNRLSIKDKELLEKKIDSKETIINKALNDLAKLAKIEKHISFHVSRHSYAQKAIEKGLQPRELQGTLNHSEFKTTEIYIKDLDLENKDSYLERVFVDDDSNRSKIASALANCTDEMLTDDLTKEILDILSKGGREE